MAAVGLADTAAVEKVGVEARAALVYCTFFTKMAPLEMANRAFSTIDPVMDVTASACILVAVSAVWPSL